MSHKKKVGPAGRFGARYGLRIRKKINAIEVIQRKKHKCPFCIKLAVKRLASGIWRCNACGVKFAGKAYEPGVSARDVVERCKNG